MSLIAQIGVFFLTFFTMEFMAWFSHKYVMHGFLWSLHKDHHHKDHNSWFERNDLFFIFYAVVSVGCVVFWGEYGFTPGLAIGIVYLPMGGYFMVHDIFIHQRFKIWRNANNRYARGVRRAHKIHHKHLGKTKGECFGMLWVPLKYFK